MFLRGRGTDRSSSLLLITGGVRSGKSAFAQRRVELSSARRRVMLATGVAIDAEMRRRIARHRRARGAGWRTLEIPRELPDRIPPSLLRPGTCFLLDCLATWSTNLILQKQSNVRIESRLDRFLDRIETAGADLICVTNEVGAGVVPTTPLGRRFQDLLGRLNQRAARRADQVIWMVSGLPVWVKGGDR